MLLKKSFYLLLTVLWLLLLAGPLCAAPPGPPDRRGEPRYSPKEYQQHGYILDKRHRHDHYYPRRGSVIRELPHNHRVVRYHDHNYYFSGGVWFRPSAGRYVVSMPPVGMIVPFLPSAYTTVWVAGMPYYYAAGSYYVWAPEYRAYRVVELPTGAAVKEEPEMPDKLFVYPKQGQDQQQQAADRYECYNWARTQTGFDPTQPGGGIDGGPSDSSRADYNRAMKACLEARGYSVQ